MCKEIVDRETNLVIKKEVVFFSCCVISIVTTYGDEDGILLVIY